MRSLLVGVVALALAAEVVAPSAARSQDVPFALEIVPEDLNADGIVDSADLATFTADWRVFKAKATLRSRSDFNADGVIDTADAGRILQWRVFCEQYGSYTTPVGKRKIGPAGGAISVDGLTLTVPAGAFASEATLNVYRLPGLPGVAEDCATGTYRIEGLPASITQPLKVTLTLADGQTTSNSTFFVLSERGWSKSGGLRDSFLPLDAAVSGSKVVGQIPPTADSAADAPAADDEPQTVVFSVFTGQRALTSPNGRIRVIFDRRSCTATRAAIIADCAERAYTAIETNCGLSWARRTRTIDITVRDLGSIDQNIAETSASLLGVNYVEICANSRWCQSDENTRELAIAVEHEMMHVAQYLYDPRSAWAMVSSLSRWLWMDEASAVFFEYHRGVDRVPKPMVLPIPTAAQAHYDFLMLHGLEYPPPSSNSATQKLVQRHGYGASMFLNYLEAYTPFPGFGLTAVGNLYRAYYANKSLRPCEALANGLGGNQALGARFADFADKWMLGTVYGATRPTRFPTSQQIVGLVSATNRVHRFRNGQSVSPQFAGEADDLSIWPAILYVPGGLPDGSTLLSLLGGDYVYYTNRCYAYKDKTQPLQYIGAAGQTGKLALPNFEDVGNAVLMVCTHNAARYPFTDRQPCGVRGMVKPIITKITPPSGPNGTPIVIEGWGFGPAQVTGLDLLIGGGPATATSWSNTRIEATVAITSAPGATTVSVNNFALGVAYPVPECTGTYPWTLTGP